MSLPPRQLAFELAPPPVFGREDFLISASNEAAYAFVEAPEAWPDRRALLVGPAGAGKTHLATIWAGDRGAPLVAAAALREEELPSLLSGGALAVEDADRIGGSEARLFHLLNLARETKAMLLLTARQAPALWGLKTPDLLSRLRAMPMAVIAPPDEGLLRALLVKLFLDRQLIVDTSVIDYLALHLDRSFDAARSAVALLDAEALSRGRRITRAMAADILSACLGGEHGEENRLDT